MSETPDATAEAPAAKRSRLPLILGVVLMLLLAGGGFYAVYSGMLFGHAEAPKQAEASPTDQPVDDVAFVPIDPVIVSIETSAERVHLRFVAQMEVAKPHEEEVRLLLPRVQDVLNGYLRAVEFSELEKPTALVSLRAQLVRRIQLVAGEGRVRDLLITEFVIN